jgi:hypothetical protein
VPFFLIVWNARNCNRGFGGWLTKWRIQSIGKENRDWNYAARMMANAICPNKKTIKCQKSQQLSISRKMRSYLKHRTMSQMYMWNSRIYTKIKTSKRSLQSLRLDETVDTPQPCLLRKWHFSYQGFRSPTGPAVQFKIFWPDFK